jgi:GNAT superfamily N-acetyltransferase
MCTQPLPRQLDIIRCLLIAQTRPAPNTSTPPWRLYRVVNHPEEGLMDTFSTARDLAVRTPRMADLPVLVSTLGHEWYLTDRMRRQAQGRGVLLVAWLHDEPVGDAYLWLEPAEEPLIRDHLAGVPLLQHVEVVTPRGRQSIGAALVAGACDHLWRLGHRRVAALVEAREADVQHWYRGLGFQEWDAGTLLCDYDTSVGVGDAHGTDAGVVCRVLVRRLAHFG